MAQEVYISLRSAPTVEDTNNTGLIEDCYSISTLRPSRVFARVHSETFTREKILPAVRHHHSYCFSALIMVILTIKTTAAHVPEIFLVTWIMPIKRPRSLMTYIGPSVAGLFFIAIFFELETELLTKTAYHPGTNGQTKCYQKTIIDRPGHYIE